MLNLYGNFAKVYFKKLLKYEKDCGEHKKSLFLNEAIW